VEFIFSHSALGVGWDNPNVFNIATLNATQSNDRKRQELGRGLRICVNQQGQRVYDTPGTPLGQEINLLTVVPNVSYEAFAQSYQEEIEEAYGQEANAGATLRENRAGKPQKKTLRRRQDLYDSQAFQQFWNAMARTTRYCVGFDEDAIVQDVVPRLLKISVQVTSQAQRLYPHHRRAALRRSPQRQPRHCGRQRHHRRRKPGGAQALAVRLPWASQVHLH